MATMTHDYAQVRTAGYLGGQSLRARLDGWLEQRRTIARITRELQTYTDRQLMDLGLCRGDIPDVARGRITR